MRSKPFLASGVALLLATALPAYAAPGAPPVPSRVHPIQEGYVDANGVLVYYKTIGTGAPLMILHGGPGASHDYLLPHVAPLALHRRLIFIDERGSGRSERLEDWTRYTVENMVEDVEAVRRALGLGKIALLGHSYGGVLAQAYALKYQRYLSHLLLCSTFHSTKAMNAVFRAMLDRMDPELKLRIEKMEKEGLYGHGKPYEQNRYTADYMTAAWAEGYFPYVYRKRPDATYDPNPGPMMGWEVYREMWGVHGEFVIDGNLTSVEYSDRLGSIKVPTLLLVGDHDECDPALSRDMNRLIPGSRLVILPESGHMTLVDQPILFRKAVEDFLGSAH